MDEKNQIINNENKYEKTFSSQFSENSQEKYYDIIIDSISMNNLFQNGWDILFCEKGEKNYNIYKNK